MKVTFTNVVACSWLMCRTANSTLCLDKGGLNKAFSILSSKGSVTCNTFTENSKTQLSAKMFKMLRTSSQLSGWTVAVATHPPGFDPWDRPSVSPGLCPLNKILLPLTRLCHKVSVLLARGVSIAIGSSLCASVCAWVLACVWCELVHEFGYYSCTVEEA